MVPKRTTHYLIRTFKMYFFMLEKYHFKNSNYIYSKVKSKADCLEIRFLSFTAVTPAGILGLCMSGREGGKEPPRLLVPHWPLCLPTLHQPSHWTQSVVWPCQTVLPLPTSRALEVLPCTPEPEEKHPLCWKQGEGLDGTIPQLCILKQFLPWPCSS